MLGNGETSPRPDNPFNVRCKQWQDLGVVEEKFYVRWKGSSWSAVPVTVMRVARFGSLRMWTVWQLEGRHKRQR